MIVMPDVTVEHTNTLSQLGLILVLYNREIQGAAANCVGCNHEGDGEILGRHITAKGATNVRPIAIDWTQKPRMLCGGAKASHAIRTIGKIA